MKEKQIQDIALKLKKVIEEAFLNQDLNEQEVSIVDIIVTGKKDKNITIYLYSNNGLDVEELSSHHKRIYSIIEGMKEFLDGFSLEVSTPGIFRKIKYVKEFNIFLGCEIKLVTNDKETIIGICNGIQNGYVSVLLKGSKSIKTGDKIITIPIDNIKNAYLNG